MGRDRLIRSIPISLVLLILAQLISPAAATAQATSSWEEGVLKVGLLEEPRTLNPWLASDVWSNKVLKLIYQPLYRHEPKDLEMVPWLAAGMPVYDAKAVTYTITLRKAKWSDGSEVTAQDVVFTGELIQKFKIPRFYSKWTFVTKMEALDKRTVRFYLKRPKATFLTRTLSTPIMPKKQWAQVAEDALKTKKPLAKLLQFRVNDPLGCGPFMIKQWRSGVYLYLVKNPHFFGSGQTIAGLQLGPNIKGILFKIYGVSDAAILALRKGSIDFYWNSIQPGYLKEIEKDKSIVVYRNKKSGMYFFGFNLRRPPFNDLSLRQAVATLVDKEFIIQRVLQGFGEPMDSVIPSGNVMFYCTGGVNYGRGLDGNARIIEAQRILKKAGYSWDEPPVAEDGEIGEGQGLRMPDGTLMEDFTILTPPADYDPNRAMAGMLIQEWLRQIGMPAFAKPMAFGSLIKMVKYTHDFDCFVLGYGSLSLDPGYVRNFFISSQDRRRGWNMSGFKDRHYDRIANDSINTMDIPKRRRLVCEMQKILRRETPYIPLYNPWILEGVRAERFQGWISMVEGIGSVWSFCTVKPVSQAK